MKNEIAGYRSLFYQNPSPSFVYEIETFKIVDVNKAALKLYGYTAEEFLSLTLKDFTVKEEVTELSYIHQNIQNRDENFFLGKFTHQTKSGKLLNMEISGYNTTFQDCNCILAVCQDNTSIEKQNTDTSQLINASLDVFCSVDKEGNFHYVSAAAKQLWGYEPEELVGTYFGKLLVEEDVFHTNKMEEAILSGQHLNAFENRYKKKDGSIAYNLWSARWDSKTKLIYCVARDGKEKLKQQQEISLSEQRFKTLVQEGSDLIAILDKGGNYTYVSATSTTVLGIPTEEFIGKNAFEFIHPEDVEKTLASLQEIFTTNKVTIKPFRFTNSKGEWRWLETVLTNMLDNPSVQGIVANSRDITESVNAQKQIEASELFNRTVLESSPDCFKVLDATGRIQYMNYNGLCQMEIDDFSVVKDKNWWTLWGTENEALVKESLNKALKGEIAQFTAFCPTAKGNPKWWDVLVSPVGKPGEPIAQIISVSRDITEQKKEEHQLKLLNSVVTNTTDAVLITEAEPFDEPGPRIIYVNEAFTKMTGYSADEVIGKSPRFLQGPNSNKKELAKLGIALRNRETYEVTTINYKKNGEEFWINFTVTPVADEKGCYTHSIAIERDVTEQKNKELEQELLAKISINFNAENDYVSASNKLCKSISKFGKFDFVELWTPNLEKSEMLLFSHYLADSGDEKFYEYSRDIKAFKLSEGLTGKVWSDRAQHLWNATEMSKDFVRKEAAKKIGLKSIMGIPLLFNDEVIGVLQIGTRNDSSYLKNYARIFQKLEGFIGSELSRKKLENDLSHLFDSIPDILCLLDFKGRFLKMNNAGCNLMGYAEEDILYHPLEEFVYQEDQGVFSSELINLEKNETEYKFENRFITKTGKIVWLSWTCKSILNEGIIYASAKNITEKKKFRELYRQSNSLAKIGSWEIDLINQTVYWSDEIYQMHETDRSSFVPSLEDGINFYRKDFQELVRTSIQKCIATGKPFDFEAVIVTAKKKEVWMRVIGNCELINDQSTRIYGSCQDINDRKEAEMRLQSLADNLPGLVFQYLMYPDGTDTLKYVTKGSEQIWGYTAAEVIQDNQLVWERIKTGGEIEKLQESIKESIVSQSKWNARWKYVLPNGEIRTHLGYGTPSFLADGTVLFNSVILDITDEAKNEELLEQVTKQAKIGSWEIELAENKTTLSDIMYDILEIDRKKYLLDQESWINFYREDFRSIAQSKFTDCFEKGISVDYEAVIITPNKNEKWVRIIGSVEKFEDKANRIYGSFQDITTLKDAENRLSSITGNLPGVVYQYVINPDGSDSLRYVSSGCEQLWGFTAEEVREDINVIWNQIKAGGEFEEVQQTILKSIETKTKWVSRIKYVMPTGELRTHLGYGAPIFMADGSVVYNSIVLDITQEVKNEELLAQASHMARIGSWELDLLSQNGEHLYWSPMIKKTLELEENYNPTLKESFDFYVGESKERIKTAIALLIRENLEFDEELLMKTGLGKERWVRFIGKSETVNNTCTKIHGSFQDIHFSKSLENNVREILGSISDAFYAVDSDWNFTYFNREAERLLEISEKEVIGKNIWEIFPTAVNTNLHQMYTNVAQNLEPETIEYLYPADKKWYEVTANPSDGGVSVYFKNIDDRKLAAEKLQKAFEEKNKILESIGDAFFAVDNNWIVTYWNKEAELLLDRKKEAIVGRYLWDEYKDAINSDFYHEYHKAVATKEASYFETYYPTLNKWFEVSAYPSDEGLSVYFKDVTLRKESDIRLEEANERFEKVTEATNDAIWDWDMVKQTYYRSKAIEKFFGKQVSQSLTESVFWKDRFHPEDLENIQKSISEAIADPLTNRWELEYRVLDDNGNIVYVNDRGVIIRNKQSKAIRMVGAMTDISIQKQMTTQLNELNKSLQQYAKELERSNEELEQFAFVASHDLQEPLRMISSFMDLLKRKYGHLIDEKGHQYIYFATDGAKRMKQIILDLLDYSRSTKPTEGKDEVDINLVVNEFNQSRRKLILEKAATITSNELPILLTYKAAVTQIFHCLLDNALKYSNPTIPPIVEINALETEDEWQISIKDNGIGIDTQFFDKIFLIFQRLHNTNQYSGTGIGLSIAKRHVEYLGGRIWLESEPENGTVFHFTIPKIKQS